MLAQMAAITDRSRTVGGVPTSLADLGYNDVGLDDYWQACGHYGPDQCTYHNEEGTPVINPQKFPSMLDMTNYGHGLNLTVGWYGAFFFFEEESVLHRVCCARMLYFPPPLRPSPSLPFARRQQLRVRKSSEEISAARARDMYPSLPLPRASFFCINRCSDHCNAENFCACAMRQRCGCLRRRMCRLSAPPVASQPSPPARRPGRRVGGV
jgi:hypothetical protein